MEKSSDLHAVLKYRVIKNKSLYRDLADLIPHRTIRAVKLTGIGESGDLVHRAVQLVKQVCGSLGRLQCGDKIVHRIQYICLRKR